MDWIKFFFGWLIKGQYEITVLDQLIFYAELILVLFIDIFIYCLLSEKNNK